MSDAPASHAPRISRRGLLIGAAAGGGLIAAWILYPRDYAVPLEPGRGEHGFGAWLKIANNGVVTVAVPQLEMGQGITTLLPQIVAAELGADWRQIAVQPAPPSGAYPNVPLAAEWAELWAPLLPSLADEPQEWPDSLIAGRFARSERFGATAWGTSLAAFEQPCREAAASARAMLAMAAAERWGVTWEECSAEDGFIVNGDRRASFGELASEAAAFDPPAPPPLFPEPLSEQPQAFAAPGAGAYPRLDLPAKVDGTFQFAADIRLPHMVHASIRHGVPGRPFLESFEESRVAGVRGLVGVVQSKRWLAAAASDWWGAERALELMRPRFSGPDPVDSDRMSEMLSIAIGSEDPQLIETRGEPGELNAPSDYSGRYEIAPAVHAALETASATARYRDGKLELWIAAQAPEHARAAAAKAAGLPLSDVVLYPMPAGGSFDARLTHIHAIEAAQIAVALGRPVQLTWPRRQEMLAVPMRPPALIDVTARLAGGGSARVDTLRTRIAVPPTMREFGHRLFDNATPESAIDSAKGEADPLAVAGAMPVYDIPNVAVEHVPVTLPLQTGPMRGRAHGYTCFATECFIDELAARAGSEPLSYRMTMLGSDPLMAVLLRRAAGMAQWDGGRRSAGSRNDGQGFACLKMGRGGAEGEGRIACVAEARPGPGGIEVVRLFAAAEIGRIVNLDIARQQIEGGLVYGLGLALGSSPVMTGGVPESARLADLNLPRLRSTPQIEVAFVPGSAAAFDPGELGVGVVAPAVANAVFAATGTRIRTLPLTRGMTVRDTAVEEPATEQPQQPQELEEMPEDAPENAGPGEDTTNDDGSSGADAGEEGIV